MLKKRKKRFYLNYGILVPYIILCIVGIIMVYSASSYKLLKANMNPAKDAITQGIYFIISLLIITFIYKMKMKIFAHRSVVTFGMSVIGVLLLVTRFTPLGMTVNGARGWLRVPGLGQVQPVEFLKIMIIWYLAYVLSRRQKSINSNFKDVAKNPLLMVLFFIALVLIQPDTGGAAILIMITMVMVFASGINYLYTLLIGGGLTFFSLLITKIIIWSGGAIFPGRFKYIYDRFAIFNNPFMDAKDKGLQMVNSYYAIFNGGLFGRGLGNSIQKQGFLPEAQTDFMFAVVVEELGLIVAIILLLLLLFLILRILMVGIKAKSSFNSMMCIGVAGMLLIQTFINIGGITGLIPLTGVTFPFLSQGGSSLLMLSISIGLVLNISADESRKAEELYYEKEQKKLQKESR